MGFFLSSGYGDHVSIFVGNYLKTNLSYLISGIFLLFILSDSRGQTNKSLAADILYSHFNTLYKLDQNLINGVKYYKSPESVSGSEFFLDEKSSSGNITVNGIKYQNVLLKYDLINQDVILEYDFPLGGKMQIIIDDEKITEFGIFEKTFKKYHFPSAGDRFFQTITAGNIVCLIYWSKMRIPTSSSLQYAYLYSEENRKTYLLMENQLCQFTGQGSFLKLFPGHEDEVRRYIKNHNLEMRNISDENLVRLLEYCDDLVSNVPTDTIR
ncbi:MAG TPA: hypothetical protein VJ346_01550 [Bacteroidales bacterium]|nr:hypothetical protein [Bacteroidales bacterium]